MTKTNIYVGNKPVGTVEGDVFSKVLSSSRHFLHSPRAICFDIETLKRAEELGARFVHIHDRDTGLDTWALLSRVRLHGFMVDRGHGAQTALMLTEWRHTRAEAEELGEQERLL